MGSGDPVKKVFVKAGVTFHWARITRTRTQGKDEHNPQFKVEDGPHWSRTIRGATIPWDPGESIENQGAPRYSLSAPECRGLYHEEEGKRGTIKCIIVSS